MNDINNVDLSERNLFLEIDPKIAFNKEHSSFVSYLKDLREFDERKESSLSNIGKLLLNFIVILTFGIFSLVFFGEALSLIMTVFQNTFNVLDHIYLLNLGIPRIFVAPVSIFSFLLAGSIMLIADLFFILRISLGAHKKWTKYHRQTLILAEKLQEMAILEDFFVYQDENKAFQLKQMSINWEMDWVYPFLFKIFPPYFHAIGEISIYSFSLISFILPIFISITTLNIPFLILLLFLASFMFVLGSARTQKVIKLYLRFKNLQKQLVMQQEEKLVELVCDEQNDESLVHNNRENLNRLINERSIPTSFSLLPLSVILSILSAIIGYVILAYENTPK
ncbi:MAG: hypothetical protein ACXABI_16050 [Candidatus Hodarchaeales archaeon]|jgi:hypothetical protein